MPFKRYIYSTVKVFPGTENVSTIYTYKANGEGLHTDPHFASRVPKHRKDRGLIKFPEGRNW